MLTKEIVSARHKALNEIDNCILDYFDTSINFRDNLLNLMDFDFNSVNMKRLSFTSAGGTPLTLVFLRNQLYLATSLQRESSILSKILYINNFFKIQKYYKGIFYAKG